MVPEAVKQLEHALAWFGLEYDEGPRKTVTGHDYGPYIQSERQGLYSEHLKKLVETQHAYPCFCTKERLERLRKIQASSGLHTLKYDRRCLAMSPEEVNKKIAEGVPHVYRLKMPEGDTLIEDRIRGHVHFRNSNIDDQVRGPQFFYSQYRLDEYTGIHTNSGNAFLP